LATLKIVSKPWLRVAIVVVSAALCFGNTIVRVPTKKKGAGPLFQIHYGNKWGFMDRTGKIVIEPQFVDVSDFFDGLAKVVMPVGSEYKSCFIDEKGKVVIPCKFDRAGDFSEGLAPVRIGRLWGYIDRSGKMVIAPQFQGASEFRGGLGRIVISDQIQCGRQIYTKDDAPAYAFDTLFGSNGGCFAVHGRFGYANKNGELAIKPQYTWAEDFSEGLAAVRGQDPTQTKFGFIDKTGEIVIAAQFDQAFSFSEGLAAVETGFRAEGGKQVAGKYGFIDKSGEFVIAPQFEFAFNFSEGLARVNDESQAMGYIDRTGRFVIAPKYNEAWDFSEGLAAVSSDDDWFAHIDKTGKKRLGLFGGSWSFSDGLTIVGQDGKRVYVDKTGKVIAPYEVNPGY
jgi:hypothetical protein